MEISEALERMRDPLGAPFFPQVFQVLLVVTWVLHIFFVTLAVGCSAFTIYGFRNKGENELRLARETARLTTSAVGLGIVTGIAPLLFIQTIYDPIWYATNALTGFWSVVFVFVVMGGYGFAYLFYLKGSADGRMLWSAVASLVLLCFAGWIMHVLASVSIRPEKWMGWYAPKGIIDTRGVEFHSFNIPRLTFLLPLQAGIGLGVVFMLLGWYRSKRVDADLAHYRWVAARGRSIALVVSPMYAVAGVAWAATESRDLGVEVPVGATLGILGLALTGFFLRLREPVARAPLALWAWFAGLLVVAVTREYIRAGALADFGYRVSDYPYTVDWGSVLVFTVTSVVGVSVLVYLALVFYQAGLRDDGEPITARVTRFGRVATGMLGAWFAFFLLVGLYTVLVLEH